MRNLFLFLVRNSSLFLFIIFEVIAFYLIIRYNQSQRSIFLNSTNTISANLIQQSDKIGDYFHLSDINNNLNLENALLLDRIEGLKQKSMLEAAGEKSFTHAKVISNSIIGRYNNFLINRGKTHQVEKGMGVLYAGKPVGIVNQVTSLHARAISMLNINFHLSAKIQGKGYFGTVKWKPPNPQLATLNDVPIHADVQVGDTIVTSGYSQVFPENLPIGVVSQIAPQRGGNSLAIDIKLFVDLGKINHIQLIKNKNRIEIDSLTRQNN